MEKYAEAVEDLTEAYRLKASPEAFSALDDAKRRKTKAESRKPSHYQVRLLKPVALPHFCLLPDSWCGQESYSGGD